MRKSQLARHRLRYDLLDVFTSNVFTSNEWENR